MLNYVDDTCTTLKVKFQPTIWVWLRQSLVKPLYLASLAVFGYGQTLRDFFFSASIGSARWLRPLTACMHARKTAVSLINFTTMQWDVKLETANVRPQHRLIKYLISNLFDPNFLIYPSENCILCWWYIHHIKSEILTFQHNSSGSARAGGLT